MMDKERKLRDTEKLYMNLRDVLSKQPDPQAAANLSKVQNALRKRGEKLKVRNKIYIAYKKKHLSSKKTFYCLHCRNHYLFYLIARVKEI